MEPTQVVEISVQDELEQALVKVNVTDKVIGEMMKKALEYNKPITNKEEYNAADEARKEIKRVRLIGEKGIEKVDRRYLDLRQASLTKKKELLERIHEPELLLLYHLKNYEKQQEEKRLAQEAAVQAMKEERKAAVQALGFRFVPGPPEHRYELDGMSVSAKQVIESEHEVWNNLYASLRMKSEEVMAQREAQERAVREEQERQKAVAEEQRKRQEELDRQAAEIQAQQERLNASVASARHAELSAMGATSAEWPADPLHSFDDAEWSNTTAAIANAVSERRVREEQESLQRQEQARLEAERIAAEAAEAERKRIEEQARIDAENEVRRKAQLNDSDKWTEWVQQVKASAPAMESEIGNQAIRWVIAGLDGMTPGLLHDLSL